MSNIDKLTKIFSENGVDILPEQYTDLLEVDSIQFVSIIVDIETEFEIEIPEEYLILSKLPTFSDFISLIECLLKAEEK